MRRAQRGFRLSSASVTGEVVEASELRRVAFTLLEVLVSLLVIALLLALLLPGVQSARATARAITCSANLHQIGVACHGFHDAHGQLPNTARPLYDLLPFIEQQAHQALLRPPYAADKLPPGPALYVCPDDPWALREWQHVSYLINDGSAFVPRNGIQIALGYEPTRFRDISDGLSLTVLFSERLIGWGTYPYRAPDFVTDDETARSDGIRFKWHIPDAWPPGQEDGFAAQCLNPANHLSIRPGGATGSATLGSNPEAYYNHLVPPNRPGCHNGPPAGARLFETAVPATSLHTGGVNVLMVDGAVRFVSQSIDLHVWRALGTRNGHEPVGQF
jgi:prepilin-type processing-associated H-X9-DG protein